jgi:hypothetical protein
MDLLVTTLRWMTQALDGSLPVQKMIQMVRDFTFLTDYALFDWRLTKYCAGTGVHSGQIPVIYYYLPEDLLTPANVEDNSESDRIKQARQSFVSFAKTLVTRGEEICRQHDEEQLRESYFLTRTLPSLFSRLNIVIRDDAKSIEDILQSILPMLRLVDKINSEHASSMFHCSIFWIYIHVESCTR